MLKKLIPVFLIAVSTPLLAQDIVGYTTARVVSIDPITTTAYNTVPRTSCVVVEQRGNTGSVAGAIVKNDNATQPQERCSTYHDREAYVKVVAYNVTFEYNGQLRTAKFNRDPGNFVNIKTVTRIFAYD